MPRTFSRTRVAIPASILAMFVPLAATLFWPNKPSVDVVHDIPAVATSMASIASTEARMAASETVEDQAAILARHEPHLTTDLTYWLQRHDLIPNGNDVQSIDFYFGSLDKVAAENGETGEMVNGHFRDQLLARVHLNGKSEPLTVLVECLNGVMFTVLDDDLNRLNLVGQHHPVMSFTVQRGHGLVHYVGYATAIDLAEQFNLPLCRGKNMGAANRITPDEARELSGRTDAVQVTVRVNAGDRFDLIAMTLNGKVAGG